MRFVLIGLVFLMSYPGLAQDPDHGKDYINQRYAGFMIQYGISYYELPEGYAYRPLLFSGLFHYPLFEAGRNINIAVDIVPQFGFAYNNGSFNNELGVNVYLHTSVGLTGRSLLGFIVGSGPHYIDVDTERQSSGFIFSDNFLITYRQKYPDKYGDYELSFYTGLRHISNAGLKYPNLGIDNIIIGICIARMF